MKKLLATISIVTALGAGAFLLNSVLPASAGGLATQALTQSSDPGTACGARVSLKGVLDKLVGDGKITQDQETAIIDALKTARSEAKANQPARPNVGPQAAPRVRVLQGMLDVSAKTIGVTPAELRTAVQGGQSVADVATAHSVAPADVVKAIVDGGNAKIDQLVTAGTITDTQGTTMKGRLPELADRFVNHAGQPGCEPHAGQNGNGSSGSSSNSDSSSSTESSSS
jgi:polyhydroxyalkanoate synthesis regulator phasin